MRRHPPIIRALIALWSFWFTAMVAEVPGLHACPVHGGHGAHSSAMGHMRHMGAAPHSHGPAGGSLAASVAPRNTATCNCLGCCCGSSSTALVGKGPRLSAPRFATVGVSIAGSEVARVSRAHALPFANAPPRGSLT